MWTCSAERDSIVRMRKAKPGVGDETKSAKSIPDNVDEYLAQVEEPARSVLARMRTLIWTVLPEEATEVISYRMPAFKCKKVLVWFGAFSNHCSLFPTAAVIETLKDELKDYAVAKGTIHFPLDKPLPAALIKKVVKIRLEQIEGKKPRGVVVKNSGRKERKRA